MHGRLGAALACLIRWARHAIITSSGAGWRCLLPASVRQGKVVRSSTVGIQPDTAVSGPMCTVPYSCTVLDLVHSMCCTRIQPARRQPDCDALYAHECTVVLGCSETSFCNFRLQNAYRTSLVVHVVVKSAKRAHFFSQQKSLAFAGTSPVPKSMIMAKLQYSTIS